MGKPLLREFSTTTNYYRQFKVSEQIDTDRSSANLDKGVLTLTIPTAESATPTRIEIRRYQIIGRINGSWVLRGPFF